MPAQPLVRSPLAGMRAGSSQRAGSNWSASGPQTHARRLTVREGMWITWPLVTGILCRTRLPSAVRTGHRNGITSSFSTIFSVWEDEGNMRSLVYGGCMCACA